ncbi:MAG: hypothetical protein P4L92_17455 [Rudaea sp.]|nr:hypothetical protein [Rudaea sp.]
MKLKFLHALLLPDRHGDLRASHCASVRTLPYSPSAANDAQYASTKPTCHWRRNPSTGQLEGRWSTHH